MSEGVLGAGAQLKVRDECRWYETPALQHVPEVVHGVTHASLGNFSLSVTQEEKGEIEERRSRLLTAAQLSHARVIAPPLHHTASVAVVRDGVVPPGIHDAFVTGDPRTVLAVTVADCVPVFFTHFDGRIFGLAHAGWRGIVGGIVRRTLQCLQDEFGVRAAHVLVAVGPAIRGPSYVVGPEVWGRFPEQFSVPVEESGWVKATLDLPSCVLTEAAAAGVPRDNLVDFALCTESHPGDLFSHRRGDWQRQWAFLGRA